MMTTVLLSRRVAAAETSGQVRFAAGGEAAHFGPLVAAASGHRPALPTDTAWLGPEGTLSAADLEAFEYFCAQHGQPATLHLLSAQLPDQLPLLTSRSYRLAGALHLYVHELRCLPTLDQSHVREEMDSARWARLAAQGFGPGNEVVMQRVAQAPGTRLFVAQFGGQDAATGALYLQGGVAALHGTATCPGFRGRGAQTALLA